MTAPQEVIAFARRMVREVRNGLARAISWLKALGYPVELTAAIVAARPVLTLQQMWNVGGA